MTTAAIPARDDEGGADDADRSTPMPASAVGVAFVALLGIWGVYVGIAAALQLGLKWHPRVALVVAQVVGLLVPALAVGLALRTAGFKLTAPARPRASLRTHYGVVIAVGVTGFVVAQASYLLWVAWLKSTGWAWVQYFEDLMVTQLVPLLRVNSAGEALLVLGVVALVPAACEEAAFRWLFQGLLSSALSGAAAVAIAAFVFSGFHLEPLGFPSRVFLGASIGLVYLRTGSFLAAALVHGLNNGLGVVEAILVGDDEDKLFTEASEGALALAVIAGAGTLGLLGWLVAMARLPPREAAVAAPPLSSASPP